MAALGTRLLQFQCSSRGAALIQKQPTASTQTKPSRSSKFFALFRNYCYSNGKKYEIKGSAVPEDDTGAKLKVSFPMTLGISSPYWVVRLGKDYEYSVVTQPGYQYIWILYR
jgi:lipocalin